MCKSFNFNKKRLYDSSTVAQKAQWFERNTVLIIIIIIIINDNVYGAELWTFHIIQP